MSVPAEDYSRNAIVCTKFDNMKFPQSIEKKMHHPHVFTEYLHNWLITGNTLKPSSFSQFKYIICNFNITK
jgi:hypothetical protein